jgi:hypothetical protein
VEHPEGRHGGSALVEGLVLLRSLRPRDFDTLYALLAVPESSLRGRTRGRTPSPEEFRQSFWANVFVQFAVEDRSSHEFLGVVTSYNVSHRNGTGYLLLTGIPAAFRRGLLMRGMVLLIDYLFANWPLRKLYFESPEFMPQITEVPHFRSSKVPS